MVSLSRYAIRAGIIFALLITILGIVSSSMIISNVQSNVNTLQDLRSDYLDADEQILTLLQNTTSQIDQVINNQLTKYLQNSLNLTATSTSDFEAATVILRNIYDLDAQLEDREDTNYELLNITQGPTDVYVMGLSVPETTSIINTGSSGAEQIFSNFVSTYGSQVQTIINLGETYRTSLNTAKQNLAAGQIELESTRDIYSNQLTEFETTLIENGTASVIQYLNLSRQIDEGISSMNNEYLDVIFELSNSPLTLDISGLQNLITTVNDTISSIDYDNIGLSHNDSLLLGNLTLDAFGVISQMNTNLQYIETIYNYQTNIAEFVNNSMNALSLNANNALSSSLSIVQTESEEFNEKVTGFISSLRTELNSNTYFIYGALVFVLAVVFIWIFITLTANIGRILNKNLKLAEGDLTIDIKDSYSKNEIGLIEKSLDSFVVQIRSIMSSLRQSSETLAGISEELAAGAEEASASINEVSTTVRQFASGSSEQNIMLNRVRQELLEHLNVVQQTANRIDETAKFVLRVAKRTNILGLNASIEAAKAGRFGLGFNVVAEEVRNLSDETRTSANQIADSIDEIEVNIRQTVEDILDEVNIINEVAENTASGSEEASVATQEQVSMMNEVSDTSNQLSELSQSLNEKLQRFEL